MNHHAGPKGKEARFLISNKIHLKAVCQHLSILTSAPSGNDNNDDDNTLEEEKDVSQFSKVFIYDAKSRDVDTLAQIRNEIKSEKFYGDIRWPQNEAQQNSNEEMVKSIEIELEQNNNEFTRYPSDYIHAQMCKAVNSNTSLIEGHPADFNAEFVVYKIFNKYTGLIGEGKTIDIKANRVLVYFAVLYLNKTRKQLVLASKSIQANIFKSHLSSYDALSAAIDGIICNQTIPQLDEVRN